MGEFKQTTKQQSKHSKYNAKKYKLPNNGQGQHTNRTVKPAVKPAVKTHSKIHGKIHGNKSKGHNLINKANNPHNVNSRHPSNFDRDGNELAKFRCKEDYVDYLLSLPVGTGIFSSEFNRLFGGAE